MYNFLGRVNLYVYHAMWVLGISGALNWGSVRLGHLVGLREHEPGWEIANTEKIDWTLHTIKQFQFDKYSNEEVISFSFDMDAKLESLFNWNTNLVFASLLCEWNNPE